MNIPTRDDANEEIVGKSLHSFQPQMAVRGEHGVAVPTGALLPGGATLHVLHGDRRNR